MRVCLRDWAERRDDSVDLGLGEGVVAWGQHDFVSSVFRVEEDQANGFFAGGSELESADGAGGDRVDAAGVHEEDVFLHQEHVAAEVRVA